LNAINIDGMFEGTFTACNLCINDYQDQFQHQLILYLKDIFISWKDEIRGDQRPIDVQNMKTTVLSNINSIQEKIKSMALPSPITLSDKILPSSSLNRKVIDLIKAAQNPQNLCMMDPTWLSWF